jgi:hypothetical protein
VRCRSVVQAGIQRERGRIDAALEERVREDCFDLGPEKEARGSGCIEQRLDAEAVTDQPETPKAFIPDREREHSPKPVDTLHPPLLVCVHHDLAITRGGEAMPEVDQLGSERAEVIYLSIESEPDGKVLVVKRLGCVVREVQDGETTISERH